MIAENVTLDGHIIDSLILAKVLDTIIQLRGTFTIKEITIGATRDTPSHALIEVQGETQDHLESILKAIQPHGAVLCQEDDCQLETAPDDGILPDTFYVTSHLPTHIRIQGQWIPVEPIEMDVAIRVATAPLSAHTIPMSQVRKGDQIVTGRKGIRVFPLERPSPHDVFAFMESHISSERPHQHVIADIAHHMKSMKESWLSPPTSTSLSSPHNRKKVLFVGGPAIVHSGGREALTWLIESQFIHILFCGNALATHDMEASLYGTSLGYGLCQGRPVPHGHEHHLRTINRIRRIGSIQQAVESGVIQEGIMAACIRQNIPFVMAGSIRDDGPLPGVITDSLEAQSVMRSHISDAGFVLLVATTLHAVATGNLLPAHIPTVCVDINPAVPTKLADRGSFQAVGLVMDSSSFLCELARELGWEG